MNQTKIKLKNNNNTKEDINPTLKESWTIMEKDSKIKALEIMSKDQVT